MAKEMKSHFAGREKSHFVGSEESLYVGSEEESHYVGNEEELHYVGSEKYLFGAYVYCKTRWFHSGAFPMGSREELLMCIFI